MPAIRLLVCLGALVALVAACGPTGEVAEPEPADPQAGALTASPADPEAPEPGVLPDQAPAVYVALCEAAVAPDAEAAREAFARAHDGLHTLAGDLQRTDQRVVAGDLLEAKQRVEAALAAEPVPEDLDARLDAMLTATADAVAASGQPRPTCPEGATP